MSEQSIQDSTETGDSTYHHNERRNLYAELKSGMENGRADMEKEKKESYSEYMTKPESRRYEPTEYFAFMVHAPLDIRDRVNQLGLGEFTMTDRPLNTSLIDQAHLWTFEGMSGLIIEPPSENEAVLGAWSYDSGLNDMDRQAVIPSPRRVLEETRTDNYNQVNVEKGKIAGVYIRIKEDGTELGNTERNQQLREFALQNGLPAAEIVVLQQMFNDSEPEIHEPNTDLTSVEFTVQGHKFRLDALVAHKELKGATATDGYYIRAREIDGYGVAGGDVTDSASLAIIADQLKVALQSQMSEAARKAVMALAREYQANQ